MAMPAYKAHVQLVQLMELDGPPVHAWAYSLASPAAAAAVAGGRAITKQVMAFVSLRTCGTTSACCNLSCDCEATADSQALIA